MAPHGQGDRGERRRLEDLLARPQVPQRPRLVPHLLARPGEEGQGEVSMRVGILGSGLMGGKLGTIWAQAGHQVTFSYARSPDKLRQLARDAGHLARSGTPAEAARDADAVLLAVNWWALDDVLRQAGDLAGKAVVTCCIPMKEGNEGLAIGHTSSGAEELARRIPKARVAAAFNTVPSECFPGVFEARERTPRPSLAVYGDDAEAKRVAMALARDAGFDPLDVGPLRIGRYAEPFALLMGQVAYEGDAGPEVAYRLEWFRG
jgi:predicted dinucleotide-binding enzyme